MAKLIFAIDTKNQALLSMALFGFAFYPIFGPETQKLKQTVCVCFLKFQHRAFVARGICTTVSIINNSFTFA
jgi:hypothetical protein